jgi:hypothetical protein
MTKADANKDGGNRKRGEMAMIPKAKVGRSELYEATHHPIQKRSGDQLEALEDKIGNTIKKEMAVSALHETEQQSKEQSSMDEDDGRRTMTEDNNQPNYSWLLSK